MGRYLDHIRGRWDARASQKVNRKIITEEKEISDPIEESLFQKAKASG